MRKKLSLSSIPIKDYNDNIPIVLDLKTSMSTVIKQLSFKKKTSRPFRQCTVIREFHIVIPI